MTAEAICILFVSAGCVIHRQKELESQTAYSSVLENCLLFFPKYMIVESFWPVAVNKSIDRLVGTHR